jgi:hypothetical protein
MIMRFLRLFAAASVLASVSGSSCAQERQFNDDWLSPLGVVPSVPFFALPEQAGPIVDVGQRLTDDRFVQTIVLQGDPATVGRNTIVATIFRGGLAPPATDEDVDSEMADSLPGIPMKIVTYPARNIFGVFGYALGTRGPVACLYAWQALDNADIWITGRRASFFNERHALSVRVRLCLSRMPPATLAALAQQLTRGRMAAIIAANNRGGRYGVLAASSSFVSSFSPSIPVAAQQPVEEAIPVSGLLAPVGPSPRPTPRFHRTVSASAAKTLTRRPERTEPLAGMPAVPMPQ